VYDLKFRTFYSVRGFLNNAINELELYKIGKIKEILYRNNKIIQAPKKLEITLANYDSYFLLDRKRKLLYFTKNGYFYYILKAILKNNTLPIKSIYKNGHLLINKGKYKLKFNYRGIYPDDSKITKVLRSPNVFLEVKKDMLVFSNKNENINFKIINNYKYTDEYKVLLYEPKIKEYYLLKAVGLNKYHKYIYSLRAYTKDFFKSKDIAYRFYLLKEGYNEKR
jgi:hypothetical protein